MNKWLTSVGVGGSLLVLTGAAFADGYSAPRGYVDQFSWTGVYIGGHGGWSQGNLDGADFTDPSQVTIGAVTGPAPITSDGFSTSSPIHQRIDGAIGGVQLGYNHQFRSVVVGTEVSATFGDVKGSGNCFSAGAAPGTQTLVAPLVTVTENLRKDCSTKQEWSAQWLQKVGLTQGRLLGYLTGGVALTEVKFNRSWRDRAEVDVLGVNVLTVTNADNWSGSAVHAGVVGGAGLQYAITNNVSFGVEYLHTQYASADSLTSGTNRVTATVLGVPVVDARSPLRANSTNTLDTDTVRAVLNFKFGDNVAPLK
jgi:outer membrane immunogenic protein